MEREPSPLSAQRFVLVMMFVWSCQVSFFILWHTMISGDDNFEEEHTQTCPTSKLPSKRILLRLVNLRVIFLDYDGPTNEWQLNGKNILWYWWWVMDYLYCILLFFAGRSPRKCLKGFHVSLMRRPLSALSNLHHRQVFAKASKALTYGVRDFNLLTSLQSTIVPVSGLNLFCYKIVYCSEYPSAMCFFLPK